MSVQNNTKLTQYEQNLNSKFEEIHKEISTNRDNNSVTDKEDLEKNRTFDSENRLHRSTHASHTEIDKDKNQDNRFQFSEMDEQRQPSTTTGVPNETLDDPIIIN